MAFAGNNSVTQVGEEPTGLSSGLGNLVSLIPNFDGESNSITPELFIGRYREISALAKWNEKKYEVSVTLSSVNLADHVVDGSPIKRQNISDTTDFPYDKLWDLEGELPVELFRTLLVLEHLIYRLKIRLPSHLHNQVKA